MGQKKISQLPADASPTVTDSIPTYDVENTLTKRSLISDLITLFFNNIPTGAHSDVTRGSETILDHAVKNTGVWTGDSLGSTRAASMTALTCYINGRRIAISAVTARTFTASKDTYIDVLDNLDGTGTLVYTEVTNNNASPALASNSLRIGIIVTGATTIAAAGSINQGQQDKVLPIASSIPYAVTDSLGNLIYPTDGSQHRTIGYRQSVANFTQSGTGDIQITGLTMPVIVPLGRRIRLSTAYYGIQVASGAPHVGSVKIYDGVVGVGTVVDTKALYIPLNTNDVPITPCSTLVTPSAASKTYNAALSIAAGVSKTISGSSTLISYIMADLA